MCLNMNIIGGFISFPSEGSILLDVLVVTGWGSVTFKDNLDASGLGHNS